MVGSSYGGSRYTGSSGQRKVIISGISDQAGKENRL